MMFILCLPPASQALQHCISWYNQYNYSMYNALKYSHLCFVPSWRNSLLAHQILTTVHETIVNGFWTLHLIQHFAGSKDLHLPQPNKLQKKVPLAQLWSFMCKDPTLGTSKPYYQKRVWEKNACWPPASPYSDEPQRSSRAIDAALTQDPGGRTITAKNRPWPNVGTQGVRFMVFSIGTWVTTCSSIQLVYHKIVERHNFESRTQLVLVWINPGSSCRGDTTWVSLMSVWTPNRTPPTNVHHLKGARIGDPLGWDLTHTHCWDPTFFWPRVGCCLWFYRIDVPKPTFCPLENHKPTKPWSKMPLACLYKSTVQSNFLWSQQCFWWTWKGIMDFPSFVSNQFKIYILYEIDFVIIL